MQPGLVGDPLQGDGLPLRAGGAHGARAAEGDPLTDLGKRVLFIWGILCSNVSIIKNTKLSASSLNVASVCTPYMEKTPALHYCKQERGLDLGFFLFL